ncbi:hypothetical protein [Brachyspira murdochii]|uniref:Uncharacterized protein n=1 Tax=Brachyspira murdochii TaxID=84378 RepID=A0ABX5B7U2_9SPIR|nr:hypothetical protein [Brachyspira murdochii]PPS23175.1 hypothetical protein DJ52_00590 [Brachyspira murdochii]
MSSSIEKEFYKNKNKLLRLDKKFIINYLFYIGYYGETYLLPPIFSVSKYDFDKIKDTAFKREKSKKNSQNTINSYSYYELLNIEIRHTETSKRLFSLMHPYIVK